MRVLITGVTEPTGQAVARMLVAGGHEVVGLAPRRHRHLDPRVELILGVVTDSATCAQAMADCVSVLHLAPTGLGVVADTARRSGIRVVAPLGSRSADTAVLHSSDAAALAVRTAPVAGRRVDGDTLRVVAALLGSDTPAQLLHTDDFERFLVQATLSDRTGVVALAAPGTVTGPQVRRALTDAGVTLTVRPARTGAREDVMPALDADWGFDFGWTAADVVADVARGLVGRVARGSDLTDGKGEIPLRGYQIPARVPDSTGHDLVTVAPSGLEGEFDDRVDPRYPVHTATNASEALPGPLTPLALDLHTGAFRIGNEAMGRMIALDGIPLEQWTSRVTSVLGHRMFINASIGVLAAANMPGWDEESIRRDVYGAIPREIALTPPAMPSGWAARKGGLTAVSRVIATSRRFNRIATDLQTAARAEALDATQIAALNDAQVHAHALLWRDRLNHAWAVASIGVMVTGAATAIHERAKKGVAQIDVAELESARTMLAVERLAQICRVDPALAELAEARDVAGVRAKSPEFATALDAELAAIGHRGPGECELINPTFGDQPAMLVSAAARAAQRPAPAREPVVTNTSWTARMATGATVARERARDAVVRYTHCLRLVARERGARLVTAGQLDDVTDTFFVTLDEMFTPPANLRDRVIRRRAERDRLREIRLPDVIAGQWQPLPAEDALTVGGELTGVGVSPGVVEGRVKVLRSLDDDIEPGDILVAAVTDTGHTAMFAYAAAVVTDLGGSASHAAIVAREFAIPCVVDTKNASATLRDGHRVRVDGLTGTITLLTA